MCLSLEYLIMLLLHWLFPIPLTTYTMSQFIICLPPLYVVANRWLIVVFLRPLLEESLFPLSPWGHPLKETIGGDWWMPVFTSASIFQAETWGEALYSFSTCCGRYVEYDHNFGPRLVSLWPIYHVRSPFIGIVHSLLTASCSRERPTFNRPSTP